MKIIRKTAVLVLALALLCGAALADPWVAEKKNIPVFQSMFNRMKQSIAEPRRSDRAAVDAKVKEIRKRSEADGNVAQAIAEHWFTNVKDENYPMYVYRGGDTAAELEASGLDFSGRHAFVVLGFRLENGEITEELAGRCRAAAAAAGAESEGAGWLFAIERIDEGKRQDLLCYTDLSGAEIFAKDADGMYYVYCHPTDVRFMRESREAMESDQALWSAFNDWAWSKVRESFLAENPGLTAVKQGSTELDLYLARLAYMPGVNYTVSTTQYGPLAPSDGFDAAPYLEKLMTGASYALVDGEAPDGEYVVLTLPDDGVRFDFFRADKNCIRMVRNDWEQFYRAAFEDAGVTATEVMQAWYDKLAEDNGG